MTVEPKKFWEGKILGWEQGRYGQKEKRSSVLEKLADRSSASLRFRMEITGQLLVPHVEGKRIVEIGCGSGLLSETLLAAGAQSYIGYDIAENAIDHASRSAAKSGFSDKARYEVAAVSDLPDLEADLVFSLGLLDWLTDEELKTVFKVGGSADFLHAIAEKRASLSQLIHRAYVQMAYGHKTGSYRPRYYRISEIELLLRPYTDAKLHVYRDPLLSFGALVSSLPIEQGG